MTQCHQFRFVRTQWEGPSEFRVGHRLCECGLRYEEHHPKAQDAEAGDIGCRSLAANVRRWSREREASVRLSVQYGVEVDVIEGEVVDLALPQPTEAGGEVG